MLLKYKHKLMFLVRRKPGNGYLSFLSIQTVHIGFQGGSIKLNVKEWYTKPSCIVSIRRRPLLQNK